eukprot:CAMPEP_0172762190 /NCGR_PEP_ID=MMETSP1074-20121228/172959_1 /TAXON_ID=2916 /ORGANISM="Ceratium fusus, Strain PA161109" /LENGTH=66 /DNA_ID=CAMNT_0013596535 /DNA_START=428 /DNA_END=628 /DNA_ORIENTATION=+
MPCRVATGPCLWYNWNNPMASVQKTRQAALALANAFTSRAAKPPLASASGPLQRAKKTSKTNTPKE